MPLALVIAAAIEAIEAFIASNFWMVISASWSAGWSIGNLINAWNNFAGTDLKQFIAAQVGGAVSGYIGERWGITLDENDPFSPESISAALGAKAGIQLRNVFDRETLLQDVGIALAQMINEKAGTSIGTCYPVEAFMASVQAQAIQEISDVADTVAQELE